MDYKVFLPRILIPSLSILSVTLFFMLAERRRMNELEKNLDNNHIVLYYSRAYHWLGILAMGFSLIIGVIAMIQNPTFDVFILFPIFFFILGLYVFLDSRNWRIVFTKGDSTFEVTSFLGRKNTYRYSDCLFYKWTNEKVILNLIQRRIQIYSIVTNYELFIAELQKNGKVCKKVCK